MKPISILFFSICMYTITFGQGKHQHFEMDMSLGIAFPTGNTSLEQTLLFSIEPKYVLSDHYTVGLRLEVAPNMNFAGTTNPWIVNVFSSVLTADYLFDYGTVKPFAGIGAGIFRQHLSNGGYPLIVVNEHHFGIMARTGLEIKCFHVSLEYNTAFNEQRNNLNYIGFKLGMFLMRRRVNK